MAAVAIDRASPWAVAAKLERGELARLPLLVAALLGGCANLKQAPEADAGSLPGDGDDDGDGDGASSDEDAAASRADGGSDAATVSWKTYDEAQKALAAKRFPGPLTAQGSRGACTASHFVWRDSDGSLHSWAAKSQSRTDYGFKATQPRPFFAPSDSYIVVDGTAPNQIAVYRTGMTNALVGNLAYAYAFAGADGSVIRADQAIDNVQLGGTKVRRWTENTGATVDVSQVLPTQQPPAAFENDELVIPGNVTIPHALYIVNVAKKTTTSVTFDGAVSARQILPTTEGLLVSYARSGGASGLRLYRNNQDTAASRHELGDELANLPALFPDSPANEHRLLNQIAMHGKTLLYGSSYGIFAYDLVTGSLSPVQLGADKTALIADIMCVIPSQGLLIYRNLQDSQGQVWAVPLATTLP